MSKMKHKTLLPVILLVLLIPAAFSLNVYIRPPRLVARMDVTPGKTSTYDGFLEIKNENGFPVNVTLEPKGDLIGKVQLTETLVALEPDELRTINFTISLNQPGNYQDVVLVTYLAEDQPGVGLQAEIIIIGTEVEGDQKPISGFMVLNNTLKYTIIGFILLITIILVLLILKKRGVKR